MSPSPESAKSAGLSAKYWLGPYAIVVSSLYLWGYWGAFKVNILEYIGISDIVKAAIYPIVSTFAFFAIGAILGEIFAPNLSLPPGGGANTPIGKALHRFAPILVAVYGTVSVVYFLLGSSEKWHVLPILFGLGVYLPLSSTNLLREEFRSDGGRSIVVFLLATLVPFAYGRGVLEASDVLEGKRFAYSITELPGFPMVATAKATDRPRYVGKADDRYVFFDPVAKSVSFIATSELKSLTLKRQERSFDALPAEPAVAAASDPSGSPVGAPQSSSSP